MKAYNVKILKSIHALDYRSSLGTRLILLIAFNKYNIKEIDITVNERDDIARIGGIIKSNYIIFKTLFKVLIELIFWKKDMQNKLNSFWEGEFGNKYINRNNHPNMSSWHNYINLLKKSLFKNKIKINSVLEYGANIGLNLLALNKIYKKLDITAVEINSNACSKLKNLQNINIYNQSIFFF